jgi:hypothetical protein
MRAKVTIHIEYETVIPDDPDCYEGAETPGMRALKEQDYLAEGGDYLIQALQFVDHRINAKVEPIDSGCASERAAAS